MEAEVSRFIEGFCKMDESIIPFPVSELADYHGYIVKIFSGKFPGDEDVCGVIDYANGEILVSEDDKPVRQRFTIAHELGHLALHNNQNESSLLKDYRRNVFGENPDKQKEWDANAFAAELLMPTKLFVKEYEKAEGLVYPLAGKFHVSPMAINMKIKKMNLRNDRAG